MFPGLIRFVACLWSLLTILAGVVTGQGGPPLNTNDPGTPGSGNWEINAGITIDQRSKEQMIAAPDLDCAYGIGNRLQLKFEVPWKISSPDSEQTRAGLGNSLLAIKWKFYENLNRQLAIATYPQFEVENPTDSAQRGLVTRGTKLLLPIEVAKQFRWFTINGEVGYRFLQVEGDEWISGLAIGRNIRNLEALGEIYRTAKTSNSGSETTVGLGGRYNLTEHLRLLVMFGRGLGGPRSQEAQLIGYFGLRVVLFKKHASLASTKDANR